VDRDGLVELTKSLVAVDTRNPPGNEAPIEDRIRAALERRVQGWQRVEPAAGRVSLIAQVAHPDGPSEGRPTLIVNGHLDVVPVNAEAWSRDPFDPEVVDGRLYGRGTADMKGGIAAAIHALDVLERAGRAPDAIWSSISSPTRNEAGGGAPRPCSIRA
jgi:acetylornithine deacetylase/succinyl-diaminopimelate desuccinylase-like protein